jgi:hypothetical protein
MLNEEYLFLRQLIKQLGDLLVHFLRCPTAHGVRKNNEIHGQQLIA